MRSKQKHDLVSMIIVVATLVTLAIGALMFGSFANSFGDDLRTNAQEDYGSTQNVNDSTDFLSNDIQPFADNYFFWFLIAIFIGVILMGLYLEFEPTTMIIIFIVGAIIIGVAWIGAGLYTGFAEDVEGSGEMTKTNVLLGSGYFPIFILVCLLILVIIMFNRKKSDYQ